MIKKNDIITAEITALTGGGDGIAKSDDGRVVFVPNTAVGDIAEILIIKVKKSYLIGKLASVIVPSVNRTESDCDVSNRCGGCVFRHISYAAECEIKYNQVLSSMQRIGKIDITPNKIVAAKKINEYRNKAQLPIGKARDGRVICGYFSKGSHRIAQSDCCRLLPPVFAEIATAFCSFATRENLSVYSEEKHSGLLRHLYIRRAEKTGEIMVCVVINGTALPHSEELLEELKRICGNRLKSFLLNINREKTNVVLGNICQVLFGRDSITDEICGVKISVSPLSFYQVNREMAEQLYNIAKELAKPYGKTVLDLYCGTGAIGLSMAKEAKRIIGVEIVESAVKNAQENAKQNGVENAEFICADAADAAINLANRNLKPDVVILDPPRKGCDAELIKTVAESFYPKSVVYISCNDATLARDCAEFQNLGYLVQSVTPVDLFPRTGHVETVCLLSRKDK